MGDAVIVACARTPIGRAYKGSLVGLDAFALAEIAVAEVARRSGVDDRDIDDIVLAESLQGGGVIARHTAVRLGLTAVPGLADNRHCAAGLSAVQIAAGSIIAGMDHVIVAGGTESLTNSPVTTRRSRPTGELSAWMSPSHPETPEAPAWDMSITVGENTARAAGLSRDDVDEWAALSHQRAIASIDAGWFRDEIVPVTITRADGSTDCFDTDEHPRRGTSVDKLGTLAVLHPEIAGATVTAGNAAGLNDASAAVVVTSDEYARAHGVRMLGRIRAWASVGVDPARTGLAPIDAIPRAIARAGLAQSDIALFEINEAFCSVPVAASRALVIDPSILNVNGSGCSLGHPIAATGTRMVITMLAELARRDAQFGCVSMCAGGGMGSAIILERL
ncbi:MAG: thiolase family protein [Actinobacteria bacterium]|nr:MAG: thiolase family protein [Actinomycetota bacterium]